MIKSFPLDFVRQALEQTLLEEHLKNVHYFGGKNQINIFSFYEQLKGQDEVDRFVETYRDLTEQQNRTHLIGNGVIIAPENPSITNLYSSTIIPLEWTTSIRTTLGDRDQMIETINNLIEKLKGRKIDIAQLKCNYDNGKDYYVPFKVGTIGKNDGYPDISNGDFLGTITNISQVATLISGFQQKNIYPNANLNWLYVEHQSKLKVVSKVDNYVNGVSYIDDQPQLVDEQDIYVEVKLDGLYTEQDIGTITAEISIYGDTTYTLNLTGEISNYELDGETPVLTLHFHAEHQLGSYVNDYTDYAIADVVVMVNAKQWAFVVDDGTYSDIIFPPTHESFEKYKLSMSFDAVRCDEPRTLNSQEYCELSFGGSATLVSKGVALGNDLIKIAVVKAGFNASTPYQYGTNLTLLEPLEMPSGSNLSTQVNQLMSARFLTMPHTDSVTPTLQYTFICDLDIPLINVWFNFARYGYWSLSQASDDEKLTPNTQYAIYELWSSWGNANLVYYLGKIVENIDIENTESDTLTISLSFQVIGNE